MANRERGERAITIDGQTYILKLTTGAMAALEDACSTPDKLLTFPEILSRVMRGSVKYLRLYLWAALLDQQPTITVEEVGRLIDAAGGVVGMEKHLRALADTSQPDGEDARPQTAQARRGTGGGSTSKRAKSA